MHLHNGWTILASTDLGFNFVEILTGPGGVHPDKDYQWFITTDHRQLGIRTVLKTAFHMYLRMVREEIRK